MSVFIHVLLELTILRRCVLMELYYIGLGGTSLINCGVFLKADEGTLRMSPWPSQIREDPLGLGECEIRQTPCSAWNEHVE
jgi:hypothetical protein